MKIQKTIFLTGLMAILLSSCASSQDHTRTLFPNTLVPTPISAITPISINPVTLTRSAPPDFSPSPIFTSTEVPPLPDEQARARLLELLANNGGCRLPCLWGITPGKSSFYEAWAVLSPLENLSGFTSLSSNIGNLDPDYIEGDMKMFTSVNFVSDQDTNIVNNVNFKATQTRASILNGETIFPDVFDSTSFGKRIRPYMLPQVLSEQGMPAAVLLETFNALSSDLGGPIAGGFDILLLYPDQGLLVHYATQMQVVGGKVRGCHLADAHVELNLYPAGHGDSFAQFLSQTRWAGLWPQPVNKPYWMPIKDVTSMSVEQFYETFRKPTNQCIETPAKLWPAPFR